MRVAITGRFITQAGIHVPRHELIALIHRNTEWTVTDNAAAAEVLFASQFSRDRQTTKVRQAVERGLEVHTYRSLERILYEGMHLSDMVPVSRHSRGGAYQAEPGGGRTMVNEEESNEQVSARLMESQSWLAQSTNSDRTMNAMVREAVSDGHEVTDDSIMVSGRVPRKASSRQSRAKAAAKSMKKQKARTPEERVEALRKHRRKQGRVLGMDGPAPVGVEEEDDRERIRRPLIQEDHT